MLPSSAARCQPQCSDTHAWCTPQLSLLSASWCLRVSYTRVFFSTRHKSKSFFVSPGSVQLVSQAHCVTPHPSSSGVLVVLAVKAEAPFPRRARRAAVRAADAPAAVAVVLARKVRKGLQTHHALAHVRVRDPRRRHAQVSQELQKAIQHSQYLSSNSTRPYSQQLTVVAFG